ncbi:TPA: hypothetical protein NJ279_002980 [Vibrio parahaemolyticus]|nr:hypothetical protein [Vibrio parahaemolyticus]EJE4689499.1 hypothetical protein [Vibrio parahaemolyticus]EJK2425447.1 hypothetical protein [Vibrio parahaemolyticus]EKN4604388.1 hypothetical protein [Vibrio parahaemolyticus]ELR9973741.1 hypothetical protein [Vibrio parahaemolyticus]
MGDSVVFDSGAVVLSANSNLTIAAINTGDSSSSLPVKHLVLDGSSSSIIEITGNQVKFESGILSMALRVIRSLMLMD